MFSSNGSQVASSAANYIEDVFSTYLYTGNFDQLTIENGIDLLGKGGMVWTKSRTNSGTAARNNHFLIDSARGWTENTGQYLNSNTTAAQSADECAFVDPLANGYQLGQARYANDLSLTYASWTFRKQKKFFDIVTWTGNGVNDRAISHSLGSAPGCIIIKRTDNANDWYVYHRSLNSNYWLLLNSSAAQANAGFTWTTVTSTTFTVPSGAGFNASSGSYVAYLFAHDAGGFGLTGTDNVISCGSFTTTSGYSPNVELGYEPQWVMIKRTDSTGNWLIVDTMRGWVDHSGTGANDANLRPDLSDAEATNGIGWPYATGFNAGYRGGAESTWIYIAIRRGPMKVPTSGTSVFSPLALNNASDTKNTTGFPVDLQFQKYRAGSNGIAWFDRLRGLSSVPSSQSATTGLLLRSSSTAAEVSTDNLGTQYGNTSFNTGGANGGVDMIYWNLRRAPSTFDEVCYTGTGSATTFSHNLGVAPELMLVKRRDAGASWVVYSSGIAVTDILTLQSTNAAGANTSVFNATAPTSSVFSVGTSTTSNGSGGTYVAYLFATCAGVSKIGSYTGTGTTQAIDCGFTAGARFVLIKRTDSTGDWYVWDTARGIVSGNDPYLLLNSTSAEVTSTDYVDPYSAGFELSTTALTTVNVLGGSYIYLAIA